MGNEGHATFFWVSIMGYKKKGAVSTAPFDVANSLSGDTLLSTLHPTRHQQ